MHFTFKVVTIYSILHEKAVKIHSKLPIAASTIHSKLHIMILQSIPNII